MTQQPTTAQWIAQPEPSNETTGRDDWCIGIKGMARDEIAVCSAAHAYLIESAPRLLAVCKRLQASAAYWSEYDVPLGIVEELNEAVAAAERVA